MAGIFQFDVFRCDARAASKAFGVAGAVVIVSFASVILADFVLAAIGSAWTELKATERLIYLQCFMQAVMVAMTLWVVAQYGQGAAYFALLPPRNGLADFVLPMLVMTVIAAVMLFLALQYFAPIVDQDLEPFRKLVRQVPLWAMVAVLSVGAPLAEEVLFRGYLLHALVGSGMRFWVAAIGANICWTLLHLGYSWLALLDVFIAGLVFSWAVWRTRSIWVPIVLHAIYNFTVFVLLIYPYRSVVRAGN